MRGIAAAQDYLGRHAIDGWLIHDFQGSNPILAEVVGATIHNTRPCFLLVPSVGRPTILVHSVDAGKYQSLDADLRTFSSHDERLAGLAALLRGRHTVAMEYSPSAALPSISRVDAGTLELVKSGGPKVVSSGDLLQFALYRLDDEQLASHRRAAAKLARVAEEAFAFIAGRCSAGVNELQVADFMRSRYRALDLHADDGPVVAVNAHSADPHYEPTQPRAWLIRSGDWVLIDFWAHETSGPAMYADMTWVGFVGEAIPDEHQRVFDVVANARDRAVAFLNGATARGERVEGWQVDDAARGCIDSAGFARHFTHRLGHSIGAAVHASGVNLDGYESRDTRAVIPGSLCTIEPGIYLERFGVRSEIDVFISPDGPIVTTPVQHEPLLIYQSD